jgi:hypothetical protein
MQPPLRLLYFESPDRSVRAATELATDDERFTVDVATSAATVGDLLDSRIDCVVVGADRSDRAAILTGISRYPKRWTTVVLFGVPSVLRAPNGSRAHRRPAD